MTTTTTAGEAEAWASLPPKELAIYLLIYETALARGYQPSLRELCEATGVASCNAVVPYLKNLRRRGWLAPGGGARSHRILRRPDGRPFDGFQEKRD